jgi:hypothetical protein
MGGNAGCAPVIKSYPGPETELINLLFSRAVPGKVYCAVCTEILQVSFHLETVKTKKICM